MVSFGQCTYIGPFHGTVHSLKQEKKRENENIYVYVFVDRVLRTLPSCCLLFFSMCPLLVDITRRFRSLLIFIAKYNSYVTIVH